MVWRRPQGGLSRQKARTQLASMILNQPVDIDIYGIDQNLRVLGVVYLHGRNVNLEMIKAGLARVQSEETPRGFDLEPYRQAELAARKPGRKTQTHSDMPARPIKPEPAVEKITVEPLPSKESQRLLAARDTNVTEINFDIGKESETVTIHLENFAIPVVFDINDANPRLVIDIHNVSIWKGKRRIPVNGRIIKQIRTYLHKDVRKQRIVLDLNVEPSADYSVTQSHDISQHIYRIEIRRNMDPSRRKPNG